MRCKEAVDRKIEVMLAVLDQDFTDNENPHVIFSVQDVELLLFEVR